MPPPAVEYVTTADGVRIAYATRGRGPVIVAMPPLPLCHVELRWKLPDERPWFDWLASRHKLVQYDPRGLGLSDRTATTYSLAARERDLEAVVDRVAAGKVTLLAAFNAGAPAIAYAAHRPDRVSHLILWCASARARDCFGPELASLLGLVDGHWELFTETAAHLLRGWSAGEPARRIAAVVRAGASPEAVRALAAGARETDVMDLLSQIRSPTLILHRRGVPMVPVECAVELASRVPNARLAILEGDAMAPWVGDMSAATRAIDEFLGMKSVPEVDDGVSAPAEMFRCEGEYWTLAFGGRLCRLRDAKGFHHIAQLLGRPGEHATAVELLVALEESAMPSARAIGDAGPILDTRAKSSYRRRLEELRGTLAEAERLNDGGRVAAARAEMQVIADEFAASVGLGGRDRRAASEAERARLTVTKRIKDALARIRRRHPALGAHLDRTIRTGVLCAYVPDSDRSVLWSF